MVQSLPLAQLLPPLQSFLLTVDPDLTVFKDITARGEFPSTFDIALPPPRMQPLPKLQ
jgi:hypothetical protein